MLRKNNYEFSNLGGINAIRLIPVSIITFFGEIIAGKLFSIIIDGDVIVPSVIDGKTKFKENKSSRNLFQYDCEFACSKDSLGLRNDFEKTDSEKYVIITVDNNGLSRVIGSKINPVTIYTTLEKGDKPEDLNFYKVSYSWSSRERAASGDNLEIVISDSGLVWKEDDPIVSDENDIPVVYISPVAFSTKRPYQLTEKIASQLSSAFKLIVDKEGEETAYSVKISELNKLLSYTSLTDLPVPETDFAIPIFFTAIYHEVELLHESNITIVSIILGHAVTLQYSVDNGGNWLAATTPINITVSATKWRVTNFGSYSDGAIILKGA